jgi:hypothetical protein
VGLAKHSQRQVARALQAECISHGDWAQNEPRCLVRNVVSENDWQERREAPVWLIRHAVRNLLDLTRRLVWLRSDCCQSGFRTERQTLSHSVDLSSCRIDEDDDLVGPSGNFALMPVVMVSGCTRNVEKPQFKLALGRDTDRMEVTVDKKRPSCAFTAHSASVTQTSNALTKTGRFK